DSRGVVKLDRYAVAVFRFEHTLSAFSTNEIHRPEICHKPKVYNHSDLNRRTRGWMALSLAGAAVLVWIAAAARRKETGYPPHLSLSSPTIFADGYQTVTLEIATSSPGPPHIAVSENPHAVILEDTTGHDGRWKTHIRAGVLGGRVRLRVQFNGAPPAEIELNAIVNTRDAASDGTPDFLRLDDNRD